MAISEFVCRVATGTTTNILRTFPAANWAFSSKNDFEWAAAFSYDRDSYSYVRIEDDCVTFLIDAAAYPEAKHVRVLEPNIPTAFAGERNLSKFLNRQIDSYRSEHHQQTADFFVRSKDGIEFPAHRFVLMAQSPFFAVMLTHDSQEKQQSRCELKDKDAESVDILLDYVYGCDTGKVTKDNAEKVLTMADEYELVDLRGFCEQTLADSISVEKALPYLVLSVQRGLDVLKAAALRMMPKYLNAVLKGKGLEEVMQSDPELMQVFMDYCAKKLPQL
ncbi:speckle-type POZ protein-like [Paramacrobiotus metropolitanus]|uniref:speckle-type POZ protein-like n=1 Tax=Paramacrobiotus metropolitanus TaxID=2943436 RepID=UPI0024457C54|nr:speckle-type POZ protein-like [Paramacrobiotus metropolitanus]